MGDCRDGAEEQDCPKPEAGQRCLIGWIRNPIPLGTAWHQQGTKHQPQLDGTQLSTHLMLTHRPCDLPRDAVTSGTWQLSTSSKLMPPSSPLHPSVQSGSFFFFAISSLLNWFSQGLQVSSSQMLSLQQCKAQQGKQGGQRNTSTGSHWLQQL